jgi:hypothetical protein
MTTTSEEAELKRRTIYSISLEISLLKENRKLQQARLNQSLEARSQKRK